MATAPSTADSIFAIPLGEPERLFGTPERISSKFRELAMTWHPDHAGRADVFQHLAALKAEAEQHAAAGVWSAPGLLEIAGRRIRHFRSFPFELGRAYLGNTLATYVIEAEFADLAERRGVDPHARFLRLARHSAAATAASVRQASVATRPRRWR